jgi:hypothetical protein
VIYNSKATRPVLEMKLTLYCTNLALNLLSRKLEVSLEISELAILLILNLSNKKNTDPRHFFIKVV